jgi:hypothetical protein
MGFGNLANQSFNDRTQYKQIEPACNVVEFGGNKIGCSKGIADVQLFVLPASFPVHSKIWFLPAFCCCTPVRNLAAVFNAFQHCV